MVKIVISDLRPPHLDLFIRNLTPYECETVSGGYTYFNLFNGIGGINSVQYIYDLGAFGFNLHDNRFYTIDDSSSVYNWFYL